MMVLWYPYGWSEIYVFDPFALPHLIQEGGQSILAYNSLDTRHNLFCCGI